jgi:hypothetical protein
MSDFIPIIGTLNCFIIEVQRYSLQFINVFLKWSVSGLRYFLWSERIEVYNM